MPQVQLLSREQVAVLPGSLSGLQAVAVTYSTMAVPPRSVLLPLESYREAAGTERVANPRLRFYPKDQAAVDAEIQAIGEDLRKVTGNAPPILEVP